MFKGFQLKPTISTLFKYLTKRAAFTLAEVLITLGIIGIVAALTMPALMGNYKKQETVSRLKKAYTVINQALMLSEADNGDFVFRNIDIDADVYIQKYWLPYFNVAKICNTYKECGYESNMPFYQQNGDKYIFYFSDNRRRVPFLTNDGILYSISTRMGTTAETPDVFNLSSYVHIDINGPKSPNKLGKDVFCFVRVNGKGILPYGYNRSGDIINTNCANTGEYCAAKIMRDGWTIKSDYPF